ncbi:MAG: cytochrome c3 family protein [Desulfuromusa sp.]|nr:cytochrome c3 family protein [Desulfuromusa sp.]
MKKLMILLAATILVSSIATIGVAETKGPEEIKFTPKMGTVTFNHSVHQNRTDCATCHHTGDYAQCKSCHGVDPKAPKAKNAYHKTCKDCHKELKKGPTKCKECHIK